MAREDPRRVADWLIVGQELWDDVERRSQLLTRAIAARHPHARILFAELPLRSRHASAWRPPRPRRVAENIWAVRPVRPFPGSPLAALSDRIEAGQLTSTMRSLGLEEPVLFTQDPRAADLVDHLEISHLVYDLTDDWAAFETDEEQRLEVEVRIERLLRRADAVFACSRALASKASRIRRRVLLLPNAVEAPTVAAGVPADIDALTRPRLGYVGTLHSSRLDVDLLVEAAKREPSWSFVLLGPDDLENADRARLLAPSNIHYLGTRPHDRVRDYVGALDVGLLTHLVSPFTESLDPLKIYEYLAAGRPIVATPVGNAPHLAEFLCTVRTAEELVAASRELMASETPGLLAARQAAVAGASWDARATDVEHELELLRDPPPTAPGVTAIVVSHNTATLLERCLEALTASTHPPVATIVVDNASEDGSPQMVRRRFPDVTLIELPDNRGFAHANNRALARVTTEHVLLLNSDAFVSPEALGELVAVLDAHPKAAAVGPRLLNPDGSLQRSAWPFPSSWRLLLEAVGAHRPLRRAGLLEDLGTWPHDEERTVDFLVGACLLIRREALWEANGFDEQFWLYGEEADLQRRLSARGWRMLFTPRATVVHVGGASSGISPARLRAFYAGQRRFLQKHGPPGSWPAARLALLAGSLLRRRWTVARIALEPQSGAALQNPPARQTGTLESQSGRT